MPEPGDTLIFFYAKTDCDEPGIYGWAVVDRAEENMLYFTPTAPTNHLKMDPWWDDNARQLTDDIRGGMPRATLFEVPDGMVVRVRHVIKKWLFKND